MRLLKFAILVLAFRFRVSPAFAGGDVNQSGELGLFTLRSGHTYEKGAWGFSLYGNEWDWRVPSDEFWEDFDPLWSNWDLRHRRASVGVGFGLTDRVRARLHAPLRVVQGRARRGPIPLGGPSLRSDLRRRDRRLRVG